MLLVAIVDFFARKRGGDVEIAQRSLQFVFGAPLDGQKDGEVDGNLQQLLPAAVRARQIEDVDGVAGAAAFKGFDERALRLRREGDVVDAEITGRLRERALEAVECVAVVRDGQTGYVLGQAQPYGLAAVVELVNHELSQGFDRYGLPPPLRVEALLQAEKTVEREAYAARRYCLCIGYALQRQNKRFFPIKRQTAVQAPPAAQRIAAQISLPLKGQRGQRPVVRLQGRLKAQGDFSGRVFALRGADRGDQQAKDKTKPRAPFRYHPNPSPSYQGINRNYPPSKRLNGYVSSPATNF